MCCPLLYWLPTPYKNGFHLAHGPGYQHITSKHFTFSFKTLIIITLHNTNFVKTFHVFMSFCHVDLSCHLVILICHCVIHIIVNTYVILSWHCVTSLHYTYTICNSHLLISLHMWTVNVCRILTIQFYHLNNLHTFTN